MRNLIITIIQDLNDSPTVNPEYTRGQLELAMNLLGYTDDGFHDKLSLITEAFPDAPLADRKRAL